MANFILSAVKLKTLQSVSCDYFDSQY